MRENLQKVLAIHEETDFENLRWKRTMTVNISRFGTAEQMGQWWKYLTSSQGISPYEVTNMKTAMMIGRQILEFQNQSVPVSLQK
jgi:hypothetical protein